jgi:hypothetical protein
MALVQASLPTRLSPVRPAASQRREGPSASQSSCDSHPQHHRQQHPLALLGEARRHQHALLGPVGPDGEEDGVEEQRRHLDVVEVAALELLEALRSSVQIRWAVDFDSFPSPAFSHSDSMSRIDRPRTNAPITIARSGSVRNTFVLQGNSFETNSSGPS